MKKETIISSAISLAVGLGVGSAFLADKEQASEEEASIEEVVEPSISITAQSDDDGFAANEEKAKVIKLQDQVKTLKAQLVEAKSEVKTKVVAELPVADVPDDSEITRERLANDLIELTGIRETLDSQLDSLSESMAAQVGADAETQARVDKVLKEVLDWEKLKGSYIDIYKDTFTSNEIAQLNAFYQSKAGRDFVAKQPELMKRSMKLMEEFTEKNQDKIVNALMGSTAKK